MYIIVWYVSFITVKKIYCVTIIMVCPFITIKETCFCVVWCNTFQLFSWVERG